MNDTKLEWTDADLEDTRHHAIDAGISKAQDKIRELLAAMVAQAAGRLHETRVDSKQYPVEKARYEALMTAFSTATSDLKIENDSECSCEEPE